MKARWGWIMNSAKSIPFGEMKTFEGFAIPLSAFTQAMLCTLIGNFAMFYCTDIVGLAPAAIGTLFLIAKVWDGIFNPIFGFIADKTETRWGKFRPYMMFASVFVSLFAVMTFHVPRMARQWQFMYIGAAYILFSMAYTVVDIPVWASPTIVTKDNNRTTTIVAKVQLFAVLGTITSFVATMLLVGILGGGNTRNGFAYTAMAYGLLNLAVLVMTGIVIRERASPDINREKVGARNVLMIIFRNKFLIIAMITSILVNTVFTLKSIMVPYFATYDLGDIEMLPVIMIAITIPGLTGLMISPMLIRKFGKRKTAIAALTISLVISVVTYFVPYNSLIPLVVLHGIISFFMFIPLVISTTMFVDCVVYAEWKFRVRAEGIVFSCRTLTGNVGIALASFLSGIILTLIGYAAHMTQTRTTLYGLQASLTLFPGAIIGLSIIPLLFYSLSQDRIDQMTAENELSAKNAPPR
jgi:sugar (glycoside-pentoside-hexuronide) transporter